jgi:hypothetical protein
VDFVSIFLEYIGDMSSIPLDGWSDIQPSFETRSSVFEITFDIVDNVIGREGNRIKVLDLLYWIVPYDFTVKGIRDALDIRD